MANPVANLPRGNIVPVPNMRVPLQGSQAFPMLADFTASAAIDGSFQSAFDSGEFDYCQSVYIDNSNNPGNLTLVFPGIGQRGQTIIAAPFTQGYYPCSPSMMDPRFTLAAGLGQIVPLIFYNIPLPYFVWGAGVSGGAGLTNRAFNVVPLINGDNQLVAGILGQSVKLWRGMFELDGPAILKFTDGPGGTVLWTADLTTLGSVSYNIATTPWFFGTNGKDLTLNSSAVANLYGGMGFQQS